jgi:hypothetical protein
MYKEDTMCVMFWISMVQMSELEENRRMKMFLDLFVYWMKFPKI